MTMMVPEVNNVVRATTSREARRQMAARLVTKGTGLPVDGKQLRFIKKCGGLDKY
jgi:hypothetical protein